MSEQTQTTTVPKCQDIDPIDPIQVQRPKMNRQAQVSSNLFVLVVGRILAVADIRDKAICFRWQLGFLSRCFVLNPLQALASPERCHVFPVLWCHIGACHGCGLAPSCRPVARLLWHWWKPPQRATLAMNWEGHVATTQKGQKQEQEKTHRKLEEKGRRKQEEIESPSRRTKDRSRHHPSHNKNQVAPQRQ